jgi:ribonuclease HII
MSRAGMDEVGRAAFAGPLVAAVCKRKSGTTQKMIKERLGSFLRDSKLLSRGQREQVVERIHRLVHYKVTAITVEEINQYGLGWANKEIMRRLSRQLPAKTYIVDGNMRFESELSNFISLVRADTKVVEVMLASVIAKLYRDRYMAALHQFFPQYGWDTNAGYGTRHHRQTIKELGITPHHRIKFVERYGSVIS